MPPVQNSSSVKKNRSVKKEMKIETAKHLAKQVKVVTRERDEALVKHTSLLNTIHSLDTQFREANSLLAQAHHRLSTQPHHQPFLHPVVRVSRDNIWVEDLWFCAIDHPIYVTQAERKWKRSEVQNALNHLSKAMRKMRFRDRVVGELLTSAILITQGEFDKALNILDKTIQMCKASIPAILPLKVSVAHYLRARVLIHREEWKPALIALSSAAHAPGYWDCIRKMIVHAAEKSDVISVGLQAEAQGNGFMIRSHSNSERDTQSDTQSLPCDNQNQQESFRGVSSYYPPTRPDGPSPYDVRDSIPESRYTKTHSEVPNFDFDLNEGNKPPGHFYPDSPVYQNYPSPPKSPSPPEKGKSAFEATLETLPATTYDPTSSSSPPSPTTSSHYTYDWRDYEESGAGYNSVDAPAVPAIPKGYSDVRTMADELEFARFIAGESQSSKRGK